MTDHPPPLPLPPPPAAPPAPPPPAARRALAIVLVAVLIDAIGFGIVMPVLPELVTRLGHLDLATATRVSGWLLAVYAVATFVAGPVIGGLSDAVGRRPVLILSMLAFGADYALMAWAPTLGWLFAGRAIAGVAGATVGPAGAAIADVTPAARRATAFGYLGAAFGVGFIVGPALGGLAALWGPRAPFWVAAACALANAAIMAAALPETLARDRRRRFRLRDAHVVGSFRPLFHAGNATPLVVAWLLWQLGGVVYPATWAFWATLRFGWGPREIGLSLAYVGLLSIVVQMGLTTRAVRMLGERRAAVLGLFCNGATMLAYAFTTQGWQVYAFFVVGALGGIAYPALNGMVTALVDETRQGALQGGLSALNSVAAIIGPVVAAQALAIGSRHGFDGGAFLVAGGLTLVATAVVGLAPARAARAA